MTKPINQYTLDDVIAELREILNEQWEFATWRYYDE